MFWPILKFEVAYHVRRPVTWLYFTVFLLLSFFLISSDAVSVAGGVGLVKRNAPFALTQAVIVLTAIGQVFTTALVGTSLLRDFRYRAHELLFTTRMSRLGYLSGRFCGAYLVMVLVFAAIPLGALIGTFAPWVDADKLLPVHLWWYIQPFLLFGLTNLLIVSAIFFAVGALTRSLVAVYTQGIVLLVAWSVAQSWLGGLDKDALANAVDAFGFTTVDLATRYWTVAERNALTLPLSGFVLTNRLIWLGVAALVAGSTFALFRFRAVAGSARGKARAGDERPAPVSTGGPVAVHPRFGRAAAWRQMVDTAYFSFRHIVRDRAFIAIGFIAAVNSFMNAWEAESLYGVTTWPVTYLVVELMSGNFFLFMVILTTIYAGESVWRERVIGADQLVDTTPTPTWAPAAGKILGVVLSLTLLLLFLIPVGMIAQAFRGYTDFQIGLYVRFLLGTQLPWTIAVTLFAFGVHALVDNKFVGHVVVIAYWIGTAVLTSLGVEHRLFHMGTTPSFTYSAMNGFGPYVGELLLAGGYSVSLGLMAAVLAVLAWRRGTDSGWRTRVTAARGRWTARTAMAFAGCVALVLVFGGGIYYNTNVLNTYRNSDAQNAIRAQWERTYRPYMHLAPPRIVDQDVTVELRPERRAFSLDGRYVVLNEETGPIDTVVVNYPQWMTADGMEWSVPATGVVTDTLTGTDLFVFDPALQPGDSVELHYRLSFAAHGFPNSGPNTSIVRNGTFLSTLGPSLGYDEDQELSDPDERHKQHLPPKDRLPDLDDPAARRNPQFTIDADRIHFAATIATAPDQIAVAPGYLQREWEEGGRRWFRYEMDRPMAKFAAVVSARYVVTRDRWHDVDLAIYHHPGHDYNVQRMMDALKAGLDYYTEHFGPYQYREVRILEFPRYARFAQSFSATIPFSESIGFILRVKDEDDDLDMPFFVTAHELAHQWWGHQVVGARAQGSALMVESMAEYSALTVMEKKYGPSHARKFLRHELDRYLSGRAAERIREEPLMRVENQPYIHYNKGSLALYALRDYIGEDAMNRALRAYLHDHAYETAPYSTARDFVGYLRAETPDSLKYVIHDLFETITLWDNRVEEVSSTRRPDGKYTVSLTFTSRKVRADSLGNETGIPMDDYMDVGVFGAEEKGNALGKPLEVHKIHVTAPRTTVELVVDEQPERAGVDPYNKLIDRVPGDNVKDVPKG